MSWDPAQVPEFIFSFAIVRDFWPLWFFLFLIIIAPQLWMAYVQEHYKRSIKWVLFELRIPREVRKTPKAMEQVFMAIHAVKNSASDIQEKWWDGEVTMWFSCEAVSFGGEVHFYMRVPAIRRNHVEAALYAQYPEIEVKEVEDYMQRFPQAWDEWEKKGYKIFGNELILARPRVYPILTYLEFEAVAEEKELDPVAALLETLSRIKPQEHIWVQILVRPLYDQHHPTIKEFMAEGEAEVNKIKEETGKRRLFSPQFGEFIMIDRSPGELEHMKAVERKITKPAFSVIIRYMYMSPAETFISSFGRRSILLVMNQYASEWINKFKHNTSAWTLSKIWYYPYIFPARRGYWRKMRLYERYRERRMYQESAMMTFLQMKLFNWGFRPRRFSTMVLNVEELATIFHPPTYIVLTGPLIKREESKKLGPPAELPIYGEIDEGLPGIEGWK